MKKSEVKSIIETTIMNGNNIPGLFYLPKIMGIISKLETCNSISEVIEVLEGNRSLIFKSFGLHNSVFDAGLGKLKSLGTVAA